MFASGVAGLVSLALGLWVTHLIEALFQAAGGLGDVGLLLLALTLFGLLGLAWRELRAIFRQREIGKLSDAPSPSPTPPMTASRRGRSSRN